MRIIFKSTKKINSKQILELYKSVNWVDNKADIKTGKSISSVYKNSQIVISAWDKDKLVGIIRALTDKKITGVIFGLLVDKNYQRQGIGKKLLDKCMAKYPKIRWYVWAGDSKAEAFYKKTKMKATKQILFKKQPKRK